MKNFETPQPEQSEPLDAKWFARFTEFGAFQVFEYLDGDKQHRLEEKKRFLSGESENPTLDYPKIDVERLSKDEQGLIALRAEIMKHETNDVIEKVYRWRLNAKIAEIRLLKSAVKGDMRRFHAYSKFIYGKPSPEVFAYTIQNLRRSLNEHLTSENQEIRQAAEALDAVLPIEIPETAGYDLPEQSDVDAAREQTLKELNHLLDIDIEEKNGNYSTEEIRDIFSAALESLKADGWSVVIETSSKTAISVDQEQKKIKIPESRKLNFERIRSLLFHEVGTHVARRLNGERSKLQLLGLGLDRYGKGEEGIATMREQVLKGQVKDFARLEGHLAISLAFGLDGVPRDFREVYEILEKHYYLQALVSGKDPKEALKVAQTNAWNRTVRTFRGTDCKTKGVCYTKDIIYREGNIGIWDVIKNSPDEMLRFSVGKYDPANPRHIWVLDQLGITEADLDRLEE